MYAIAPFAMYAHRSESPCLRAYTRSCAVVDASLAAVGDIIGEFTWATLSGRHKGTSTPKPSLERDAHPFRNVVCGRSECNEDDKPVSHF